MTCYMCGSPATKRLSPDLDIAGLALCDKADCHTGWVAFDDTPELLEKWRKRLHKARGNKYTKA